MLPLQLAKILDSLASEGCGGSWVVGWLCFILPPTQRAGHRTHDSDVKGDANDQDLFSFSSSPPPEDLDLFWLKAFINLLPLHLQRNRVHKLALKLDCERPKSLHRPSKLPQTQQTTQLLVMHSFVTSKSLPLGYEAQHRMPQQGRQRESERCNEKRWNSY